MFSKLYAGLPGLQAYQLCLAADVILTIFVLSRITEALRSWMSSNRSASTPLQDLVHLVWHTPAACLVRFGCSSFCPSRSYLLFGDRRPWCYLGLTFVPRLYSFSRTCYYQHRQ